MHRSPEQFEPIYQATARPLKAYLQRLVRNPALADELLQETYYHFLRSGPAEDTAGDGFRSYLFRIASNLATDQFRRRRETGVELTEVPVAATAASGDADRLLGHLNPRERELVWLAYGEGASHREIAATMGMKEASVRPLLHRVRHQLRDIAKAIGLRGGGNRERMLV
jgi:RNA polymerase sigma-70 factor, ECF subfamily